ncbi:DUF1902 domain-containing protein [bacterium]|nr:DUF1902 domain-containing protein [bacterium]
MRVYEYSAVVEYDPEARRYIGYVPALRGAHTEADSIEELRLRLEEVVELILEEMDEQGAPEAAETVIGLEKVVVQR